MEPPIRVNEHVGASAVVALAPHKSNKREREEDAVAIERSKVIRMDTHQSLVPIIGPPPPPSVPCDCPTDPESVHFLRPYPYFLYRDYSSVPDPDPFVPLTSPGRVPNFPAKMHSILSRADLADVVAWMPHGRAWRVLKPREFEVNVIPTYFEHAKFSSFIRQANGWGFRRVTQGRDRNSYYHEMFLRGLPHLCKMMKRPGVAEKVTTDPDHEPDFFKISEEKPVPESSQDESILLHCTLQGGPKARMPVCAGNLAKSSTLSHSAVNALHVSQRSFSPQMNAASNPLQVRTNESYNDALMMGHIDAFHANNNYSTILPAIRNSSIDAHFPSQSQPQYQQQQHQQQQHQQHLQASVTYPQSSYAIPPPAPSPAPIAYQVLPTSQNQVVTPMLTAADTSTAPNPLAMLPMALQGNSVAAAQFAAGFAAATALSNQNIRQILGQALASLPTNNNSNSSSNHRSSTNDTHQVQQQGIFQQQQQQQPVVMRQHTTPQQQHLEQKFY